MIVRYSTAKYAPYKAYIREAIRESKETGVVSWDERNDYIEAAAGNKDKIEAVLEDAKRRYLEANGIQELTVSIAVDGRIDVPIFVSKNASHEAIRDTALNAFRDADLSQMEVVGGEAVNVSDSNGELLFDFD